MVRKKVRLGVQKPKKQIFDLVLPFFYFALIVILKYPFKDFLVRTEEKERRRAHDPDVKSG